MKKTLKFFVMAFAALAFMGCPTTPPTNEYTKIAFKESAVQIGVGGSDKLIVLYEPTTVDAPKCEWASSDTTVVAVDQNGTIYGLAAGSANVTAKVGELEAVCQVEVLDPMQLIEWGGFSVFGLDKSTILSKDTFEATLSTGQDVKCVMIPATYYVWDTNIFMDESGYLNGAGYIMTAEGTAWLITDDLGKGPNFHYLGMGSLEIVPANEFNPTDTAYACCAAAGTLGDAKQQWAWLTDTTDLVEPACVGTVIDAVDFNAGGKYLAMFSGYAGPSIFVGDETSALYMANVAWFDYYSAYGLTLVETPEGYNFKQPVEWAKTTNYYYEYLGEEAAPKYVAKEVRPMQDIRKFNRALPTDVMIKK